MFVGVTRESVNPFTKPERVFILTLFELVDSPFGTNSFLKFLFAKI